MKKKRFYFAYLTSIRGNTLRFNKTLSTCNESARMTNCALNAAKLTESNALINVT